MDSTKTEKMVRAADDDNEDFVDFDESDISVAPTPCKKLFTYFGNKQYISEMVWKLFGKTGSYSEPFCGCSSVLLSSPYAHKFECINDYNCHIANVFRSVKYHYKKVIDACYYGRTEIDLHMRHDELIKNGQRLRNLIMSDPKACDPELAGWWIWGINLWIGGEWCSEKYLDKSCKQKPTAHNKGILNKGDRLQVITSMVKSVHDRLIDVTVCYGDFERVLTPSYTTKFRTAAVFLDPPYKGYMGSGDRIYADEQVDTWERSRDWFLAHNNDPAYRIILCGQRDDWPDPPPSVKVYPWTRAGGMVHDKSTRTEQLWASRYCICKEQSLFFPCR